MTLGEEERMLWSRMLLSCLVDADYTASAEEDGEIIPEPPKCDAENWLERLNAHRAELARNSTADKKLNALRNELFETCGRAGDHAPGIYTLTAPTGTGKTLALLHFALRQCRKNGQQRIIIVLPFITLTETSVYKRYKQDKIEMRGDRAEMSDFPLYLNTVAGGLDRRDQTIGGFSFVVKIYAVPVIEIIG